MVSLYGAFKLAGGKDSRSRHANSSNAIDRFPLSRFRP
nr:MAG TPA: hypothetical protein [Caudoviricetes sp.]